MLCYWQMDLEEFRNFELT